METKVLAAYKKAPLMHPSHQVPQGPWLQLHLDRRSILFDLIPRKDNGSAGGVLRTWHIGFLGPERFCYHRGKLSEAFCLEAYR